jgi:hypothetical protein
MRACVWLLSVEYVEYVAVVYIPSVLHSTLFLYVL